MNDEVNDFLKGLDNEPKEDPFKAEEDPFSSTEEAKEEEKDEDKDKPLPFHKDPKVQKFIDKEVEKKLAEFKPQTEVQKFNQDVGEDEMAEVLTRIIGNDTPEKVSAIKDFKKVLSGLEEKGAQKAMAQIQAIANEEKQAELKAQTELADGLESIEEEFGIDLSSKNASKVRGEYLDFIAKIAPKDENGQISQFPDFKESFALFKERRKPEPNTRAKELASRGMQRSSDASEVKTTGRSWNDIDRIFGKLSG